MFQKSHVFIASCGHLHPLCPLITGGSASAKHMMPFTHPPSPHQPRRTFAWRAPPNNNPGADKAQWPQSSSNKGIPTPYEIFKQTKGAPYSKRRFYELVKIYHPDRDIHEVTYPGCVSRATRLERYRLIIAANEILSDPVKRSAYDRWGAGWNGIPDVIGHNTTGTGKWSEGKWTGFDDNSPMGNATWEDWENWRQGTSSGRSPQRPIYFSNGSFVVLIVLFALAGGYGEVSRANHFSRSLLQQIEENHVKTSKELRQRRLESQELESQKHRVENFLRVRERGYQGGGVVEPPPPDSTRVVAAATAAAAAAEAPKALRAPVHVSGGINGQ